jgi:hypothetical protein
VVVWELALSGSGNVKGARMFVLSNVSVVIDKDRAWLAPVTGITPLQDSYTQRLKPVMVIGCPKNQLDSC